MNMAERVLECITPRSALGLTLLTLSVIILMLGFLHPGHPRGRRRQRGGRRVRSPANQTPIPRSDTSIRLGPGESYRTGPATPSRVEPLASSIKPNAVAPVSVPSVASSLDPAPSIPVQPSKRDTLILTAAPRVSPG